eukprot:TRINITY_DN11502_c0_g2_i1.p1 TRINITY_DN11502_c0_g2~~TRINITY_DN11502_c0_g2_i1.p1  ORF type:complete len:553 (+),score=106.10 TRINITY_DN11502_c0_g2_i1:625-2283(+)
MWDLDIVTQLLRLGGNLHKSSPTGSLLHHAVYQNPNSNTAVVEYLLANGIDPNTRTESGKTALILAIERKAIAAADTILRDPRTRREAWKDTNNARLSPLHLAVYDRNRTCVELLLDHGCDINALAGQGKSPLHIVAESYQGKELIPILIQRGADPNLPCQGRHVLELVLKGNHGREWTLQCLTALLENGANPNGLETHEQVTRPLHVALETKNHDAVSLLVRAGADLSLKDNQGRPVTTLADVLSAHALQPWVARKTGVASLQEQALCHLRRTLFLSQVEHWAQAKKKMEQGKLVLDSNDRASDPTVRSTLTTASASSSQPTASGSGSDSGRALLTRADILPFLPKELEERLNFDCRALMHSASMLPNLTAATLGWIDHIHKPELRQTWTHIRDYLRYDRASMMYTCDDLNLTIHLKVRVQSQQPRGLGHQPDDPFNHLTWTIVQSPLETGEFTLTRPAHQHNQTFLGGATELVNKVMKLWPGLQRNDIYPFLVVLLALQGWSDPVSRGKALLSKTSRADFRALPLLDSVASNLGIGIPFWYAKAVSSWAQ